MKKLNRLFETAFALLLLFTTAARVDASQAQALAKKAYAGKSVIIVEHNKPDFSKKDLSKSKGAWQAYSNLDRLNRVQAANALLNKKLMPTAKREPLNVNPTGWHNKRISGGWLFNRCHLIGYQLTSQNNNWKNLMTGTRQLNDPDMLKYENIVANYVRSAKTHYVRYRVTPVFRGNELLARGVEMEGQSVGSNAVRFHVYIFNVQPGVKLNYKTGTSKIVGDTSKAKKSIYNSYYKRSSKTKSKKQVSSSVKGKIVGNKNTKIYHVPGQFNYKINKSNAVYFQTEAQAQRAGYRKSKK
ncbi:MAG: DNA/RNA non-specific endonuclease [Lactobacillus sp.]|nr:DNA/RNA non-specific endonuclease [Lactobacillus sp.]